jgi:hypothetical protein
MSIQINLYSNSKIYIACPANIATGGPELLHQLAYHFIKDLNVTAFMYYYNFNRRKFKTPVHLEYVNYNLPFVLDIPDEDDIERNILIVPETMSGLSLLPKYKKIRKGIWFLSVDNYYLSKLSKLDFFFSRSLNKISKVVINKTLVNLDLTSEKVLEKLTRKYDYRRDPFVTTANFYMTNSYRGLNWFSDLTPLFYLSEYLNKSFLLAQVDFSRKENIVVYNPQKGFSFTKNLIYLAEDIKFVPLINMGREEVIETLKRAKVYIDFGNHPGKDRLPREAAILGCCVIVGRRGSAAFFEDVPIPDEYRFENNIKNASQIIEKIQDCFRDFENRYKDFEYYRQIIRNEPQKFLEDLKKIFNKIEI